MNHDVPLVARKRTVVRVYLSANTGAPIAVQGVLKTRRLPNGPWRAVRSLGPATIDPADNGQLRLKREHESKSLNFLLPESVCHAGFMEVRGPTYTVQISTDDGRTWQTAGFALREPQVTIDRQMIGEAETVRVRVTATNGFESASAEKTMKAADL